MNFKIIITLIYSLLIWWILGIFLNIQILKLPFIIDLRCLIDLLLWILLERCVHCNWLSLSIWITKNANFIVINVWGIKCLIVANLEIWIANIIAWCWWDVISDLWLLKRISRVLFRLTIRILQLIVILTIINLNSFRLYCYIINLIIICLLLELLFLFSLKYNKIRRWFKYLFLKLILAC